MQRDLLLLGEMIEAAEQICQIVEGRSPDDLAADRLRRDALLWNFTVLGEAAVQVESATKERFPAVAWAEPARLRNRVVHGYWSIDLEILHVTAIDVLPGFVEQLRAALAVLESDEPSPEPSGP